MAESSNPVPPPEPTSQPPAGLDERGRVKTGKAGGVWIGVVITAILLVLLIIFLAQNSRHVTVHYLGASGNLPCAIALLIAAVVGALLVAIPGTVRILQLRRALKKNANRG